MFLCRMTFITEILLVLLLCGGARGSSRLHNRSEYLLMLHNRFRLILTQGVTGAPLAADMIKMTWDPLLQREAEKWAQCDNIGLEWGRTVYDDLGIPLRGKNSAIATRGASLYKIVRRWYMEKANYDFEYQMCHPGKPCRRFQQLASAQTSRMGCSVNVKCEVSGVPVTWLLCIYAPGVDETRPLFRSGPACTKCVSPKSFCQKGLCVACEDGPLADCNCRKTCFSGNQRYGKLDRHTCTCDCEYGNGPNCDDVCTNPDQYLDYDVCEGVSPEECTDPATSDMMMEFCPEQCTCKKPFF